MKKAVIIGAGYAGVLTAQHLRKKLPKEQVAITVIDQNPYHTMKTEIHAAATGRGKPEAIIYSLKDIFDGYDVELVTDKATDIDFAGKKVLCEHGTYEYDYLVISAGSKPAYFGIPGAEEYTLPFWTYNDAVALKNKLDGQFAAAGKTRDPAARKKLLSIYVIGAGLTGVELAGELAEYIPILCKRYKISRDDVSLYDVDALPRAISNFPEKLSARCDKILTELGVNMQYNVKVKAVSDGCMEYEQDGKTCTVDTGLVIWTAGITANDITQKAAEHLEHSKGFRLVEGGTLQSVTDDSVFIAGDNMWYVPKGKKTSVPQMVENCERASSVVAKNIAAAITGKPLKVYHPHLHGAMISLGAKKGITYFGVDAFKIPLPSLPTQIFKRAINIVYLAPVVGFDQLPKLIAHEFFARRK